LALEDIIRGALPCMDHKTYDEKAKHITHVIISKFKGELL